MVRPWESVESGTKRLRGAGALFPESDDAGRPAGENGSWHACFHRSENLIQKFELEKKKLT